MQEASRSPPTVLFTLRLWQEPLDESRTEWRGEIKNLASGEARYFRRWDEIPILISRMVEERRRDW